MEIIEKTFSPILTLLHSILIFFNVHWIIMSISFVVLMIWTLLANNYAWAGIITARILSYIRSFILKILDSTYGVKRFIFIAIIDVRMIVVIADTYGSDSESFTYAAAWLATITSITAIISNMFPYKKFKLVSYAGLTDGKVTITIVNIGSKSALVTGLAISFIPRKISIKKSGERPEFKFNHRYRLDLGFNQSVIKPNELIKFEINKEDSSVVFDVDAKGFIRDNFFELLQSGTLSSSTDVEDNMRITDSEIWLSVYGRQYVVKNRV